MSITIFFNGQFKRADKSWLESLTPGYVEGQGVFETMKFHQRKILDFDEHMDRMTRGLRLFRLKSPFLKSALKNKIEKVLSLNKLSDARLRVMVWQEKQGTLHTAIIGEPLSRPAPRIYKKGFTAIISKCIRHKTEYSHIKSIRYQIFRRALLEAKAFGFNEAILLNPSGSIVE